VQGAAVLTDLGAYQAAADLAIAVVQQ